MAIMSNEMMIMQIVVVKQALFDVRRLFVVPGSLNGVLDLNV